MAHFKTLFLLSLLFAVVLVVSSRSSPDNEPGVAQTQGGTQVDHHGGGGGWGGGGGHYGGGGGHYGGGGGGWGGWGGGGGGGGYCHYPHCKEGVHGDTETKSGETESNTNENGDTHKPYKP